MSKKPVHPPYLAKKLLSFMRRYSEEYSSGGDLVEEYREIAKERGKCTACLWYWWHVLYAIHTYILLQIEIGGTMFTNYLKIALRNMKRHKGYSFINIASLALGIACCFLISSLIIYELSYDDFHENSADIYRMNMDVTERGRQYYESWTPDILRQELISEYPEIVLASRINRLESSSVSNGEKVFNKAK